MRQDRIPAKGGAEADALSRKSRHLPCYLARPGFARAIKKGYNKRAGAVAKRSIRQEED